jgi:6-phosphofructokinase 1
MDGVYNGYAGLVVGQFEALDDRAVGDRADGGILQRCGTMLGSLRFTAFREEATQQRAVRQLRAAAIDGLVVIGGGVRAPVVG